ncbi:hypothetical protein, partial [Bacteroides heparinolyticus]|uniref:hypothetical protein n=1 Tax=Prevotella heparinolytica TaxID=28113 RepID=UPI0035A16C34
MKITNNFAVKKEQKRANRSPKSLHILSECQDFGLKIWEIWFCRFTTYVLGCSSFTNFAVASTNLYLRHT